jgi:hypothetical protein
MLRLVDITSKVQTGITFHTEEITAADTVPYIIYDTSSGSYNYGMLEDYYGWRATTVLTSSGASDVYFTIDNTNLYPSYLDAIVDYNNLRPSLLKVVTYQEYVILQNVLIRLDLVRRRYPNPGYTINSTNSVGQNGTVSFAGGYEKKMSITEIGYMMEAAIVEINATSPMTYFWPAFMTTDGDKFTNPYVSAAGLPYDLIEVATLGTLIRCLVALGLMEVDLSFQANDSGLQITWDRATHAKGWHDSLLADYKEQKLLFKMNHANHAGVGVGTVPWAAYGIWGTLLNNATYGGTLAYSSIMGFGAKGNVPM